jgi:hypothetical protein
MLDRNRGEKSRFVLIAISSFEATWNEETPRETGVSWTASILMGIDDIHIIQWFAVSRGVEFSKLKTDLLTASPHRWREEQPICR